MALKYVSYTDVLAGTVPTLETEGQFILGHTGVCAVFSAPSGQTFTSGTMRMFVDMPVTIVSGEPTAYRWVAHPAGNVTLTSGVRDQATGDLAQYCGAARRLVYVPDTVILSGGSVVAVVQAAKD